MQKGQYKFEVIKGLLLPHEVQYNKMFWKDEEKFTQSKTWNWSRFHLIDKVDATELSFVHFRGERSIQGPLKVPIEVRDYILIL